MRESEKKILRNVGLLCRNYRLANGQTLKDVSIRMGCSMSSIGYFERGRNDSAKMLMWYVEHYKIPIDKIINIYNYYQYANYKEETK